MVKKICLLLAGMLAVLVVTSPVPAADAKIAVLSPLGQPPPITRVPMAPRIENLEGKTIYIVDIGFTDTERFFVEMQKLLIERFPKTNFVIRRKIGNYFDDDPKLWAEIKEKGHGMIMGIGH